MLRLRCFGRLAIEDEGGERIELRSRKHLALLLYLAAHRDRRHDRERVARLFWDTEVSLARHSLSQALYDLGKHLPGLELDRTNREVGLGSGGLLYEGRALEEAVAGDELGRAVGLYDGPFAPDIETVGGADFERWVERERTRYRSLAEKALLRRVSECADAGRWGEMCVAGNRLVDLNPLNEEAHRAVMRGLWLQGDRAAALAHFEEHEDFLRRELSGGIGEETRALVERIRRPEPTGEGEAVRERTRPEMVGREEEFRALGDALDEVLAGESRFVLVRGEAGIGKTRLLEEFAEVVGLEDVRLLESRCYAAESDVPYGPIVDGLRELVDEVDEGATYHQLGHLFPEAFGEPERDEWDDVGKQTARRRLAEEIRGFLEARLDGTPTAWFIEDLHWADSTSLWMLSYLARRLEGKPILVVATSRREVAELAPEGSATDPWQRVRLGRLSSEEIEDLISAAGTETGESLSDVAHLADGNPFYALELAKSNLAEVIEGQLHDSQRFREELPAAIARVLKSEIADLSHEEARILEVVAVAEGHAYPNLVIDATDLSTAELVRAAGDLRQRGLLRSTDDRLIYGHDIVRRFVYHSLDALSRTALHREIADWLAENRDEVDPGTLALHYHEADDSARAYELAVAAARSAIERHANQEAINLSRLALDCAATRDERRRARCLLGESHYREGHYHQTLRSLNKLGNIKQWTSVTGKRSMHLYQAAAAFQLSRWKTVKTTIEAVDAEPSVSVHDYLWGRHLLMKAAVLSDDTQLAERTLADVLDVKTDSQDVISRAMIWMTRTAYGAYYGPISECRGYLTFVQQHAGQLPAYLQFKVRNLSMLVGIRLGLIDIAQKQGEITLDLVEEHQDTMDTFLALSNISATHLAVGAWEKAKAIIDRIEAEWFNTTDDEAFSNAGSVLALNKGDYLLGTEQFEKAERFHRQALARLPNSGIEHVNAQLLANRGLCAVALGRPAEAVKAWQAINEYYPSDDLSSSGVQNRYKIYWVEGMIRWYQNEPGIVSLLRRRADEEEKVDRLSAARLQWVAKLLETTFDGGDTLLEDREMLSDSTEFKELRKRGMTWFGYFARRFFKRACANINNREVVNG